MRVALCMSMKGIDKSTCMYLETNNRSVLSQRSRISTSIASLHNTFQTYNINTSCLELIQNMGADKLLKVMYMISNTRTLMKYTSFYYEFTCELIMTLMDCIRTGEFCGQITFENSIRERLLLLIDEIICGAKERVPHDPNAVMQLYFGLQYIREMLLSTHNSPTLIRSLVEFEQCEKNLNIP